MMNTFCDDQADLRDNEVTGTAELGNDLMFGLGRKVWWVSDLDIWVLVLIAIGSTQEGSSLR